MTLLRERYGVDTVVANPPCHTHIRYLRSHTKNVRLPRSEDLGRRLFCLPIHPAMSDTDNRYICAAVWEAVRQLREG